MKLHSVCFLFLSVLPGVIVGKQQRVEQWRPIKSAGSSELALTHLSREVLLTAWLALPGQAAGQVCSSAGRLYADFYATTFRMLYIQKGAMYKTETLLDLKCKTSLLGLLQIIYDT